jgi:hypothetical protein
MVAARGVIFSTRQTCGGSDADSGNRNAHVRAIGRSRLIGFAARLFESEQRRRSASRKVSVIQ